MRTALHDLQQKEDFLKNKNKSIFNELTQLESLTEKKNEENVKPEEEKLVFCEGNKTMTA